MGTKEFIEILEERIKIAEADPAAEAEVGFRLSNLRQMICDAIEYPHMNVKKYLHDRIKTFDARMILDEEGYEQ